MDSRLTLALTHKEFKALKNYIIYELRHRSLSSEQSCSTFLKKLTSLLSTIENNLEDSAWYIPKEIEKEKFAKLFLLKIIIEEIEEDTKNHGYRLELSRRDPIQNACFYLEKISGNTILTEVYDKEKDPDFSGPLLKLKRASYEEGVVYVHPTPSGLEYVILDMNTRQKVIKQMSFQELDELKMGLPDDQDYHMVRDSVLLTHLAPHLSYFLEEAHKSGCALSECASIQYKTLLKNLLNTNELFKYQEKHVLNDNKILIDFIESLTDSGTLSQEKSSSILLVAGNSNEIVSSDLVEYLDLTDEKLYKTNKYYDCWKNIFLGADYENSSTNSSEIYLILKNKIGEKNTHSLLQNVIQKIREAVLENQQLIKNQKTNFAKMEDMAKTKNTLNILLIHTNSAPQNFAEKQTAKKFILAKITGCTTIESLTETYITYKNHPLLTTRRRPRCDAIARYLFFFGQYFYTNSEIEFLIACQNKFAEFETNTAQQIKTQTAIKVDLKDLISGETVQKMRGRAVNLNKISPAFLAKPAK